MTRIADAAPYWILGEIRTMLGDRAIRAVSGNDVDELRRITEAVAWLRRPMSGEEN